jgi:uncharacterized membrane protein (UPF0127 family)
MRRFLIPDFQGRGSAASPKAFFTLLAATILLTATATACTKPAGPAVVLRPDEDPVRVRIQWAITPSQLSRGLMWRDHLDGDAGMLFVFGDNKPRSFWMKNTPISLDIVFIDPAGIVVAIAQDTEPYSLAPIPSGLPAKFVLEVNAGFTRRNGIVTGTRTILPTPPGR